MLDGSQRERQLTRPDINLQKKVRPEANGDLF